MNIGKKILDVVKALHRANVAEVEEIKSIVPTQEDKEQAEVLVSVAMAAMSSMGVPAVVMQRMILEKIFAYGIRDIKNGINSPKDLLLSRVITELKRI